MLMCLWSNTLVENIGHGQFGKIGILLATMQSETLGNYTMSSQYNMGTIVSTPYYITKFPFSKINKGTVE